MSLSPQPASRRRLAARVTPDALRQVRGGHPWVFESSVDSISAGGRPGDLAVIFDERRRFAAIGLFDPSSPIRIRVLHCGRPLPIDAGFWRTRIEDAVLRRAELAGDPSTTAYRCVHGENDGLPGLVVDRYEAAAVIKLDTAALLPHLEHIVPPVVDSLGSRSIVLRLARSVDSGSVPDAPGEGAVLHGRRPDELVSFLENGLLFEADLVSGQKTGHFLDQRENRRRVRDLAIGARVLDVFCCTGGFSVAAAAGDARSVTGIDRSRHALEAAERNFQLNRDRGLIADGEYITLAGDAFEVMERLQGQRFDVVVIDPPSFAANRASVPAALGAYRRLTELGLGLIEPGGTIFQASCSSRVTSTAFEESVVEGARTAGFELHDVLRWGHAIDHPVGFANGAYLKAVQARAILRR